VVEKETWIKGEEMSFINTVIGFFKSSSGQKILSLGRQILKIYIGPLAQKAIDIAKEEVAKAELTTLAGPEKRLLAFRAIKARLSEVKDSAIDGALTLAVLALKSK
jgi:hypothetical protein